MRAMSITGLPLFQTDTIYESVKSLRLQLSSLAADYTRMRCMTVSRY